MMNRRNVIIGLGGLVAGGGVLIGTGAFDAVEAERTVNVETAGDAEAFLGLEPEREDFVEQTNGTIEFFIDADSPGAGNGLNQNAVTTFRNLVRITNQGTQEVDEVTLEFDEDMDDLVSIPIDQAENADPDPEETDDEVDLGGNLMDGFNGTLGPGEAIVFGFSFDLIGNDLPDEDDFTLTIEANAED